MQGQGRMTGHGVANLGAVGSGEATTTERHRRTVEGSQQQIDHLGMSDKKAVEAAKQ